ncbi:hypothetical protein IGI04_030943 [Brassica rapa subsp. trilocularis]|uniref:Uncharacterized protein n=1 Tax=Brassica rapa subsp. trilocularis TaxID=1813537 RepID=A0ABQ7LS63_BRACM|nr:hypothetical protein IGI04_030943 [Brassica rapa subsp. trilocularis]
MCRQNCCAKSSQEEEVISPPDENLLIYCKPVRLYNILRIRSLYNVNQLREVVTDGEKSKAGKKRAKAPWAKPLSQYSQATRCDIMNNIWVCGRHTLMRPGFNDAQSPKAYTTEDYLKITEEQLKASSPGKIQREDQIQTQERAVQSQPEVTSRETMAASSPRQD